MGNTFTVRKRTFPSGVPALDALAAFAGVYCLQEGASLNDPGYGWARVRRADAREVARLEDGREFDPFHDPAPCGGPFVLLSLRVSAERGWAEAAFEKAWDDVRHALLVRAEADGEGPCDDDVPGFFDGLRLDKAVHWDGACGGTMHVWWEAA